MKNKNWWPFPCSPDTFDTFSSQPTFSLCCLPAHFVKIYPITFVFIFWFFYVYFDKWTWSKYIWQLLSLYFAILVFLYIFWQVDLIKIYPTTFIFIFCNMVFLSEYIWPYFFKFCSFLLDEKNTTSKSAIEYFQMLFFEWSTWKYLHIAFLEKKPPLR